MHIARDIRRGLFIGSTLTLLLLKPQALHAEDAPANESSGPRATPSTLQSFDTERPPPLENEKADSELDDPGYSDTLALSYIFGPPLIGAGLTFGLSRFNSGTITFWHVMGGVLGSGLVPAMVHWANNQTWRGFRALLVLPSLFTAAMAVVTLLSYGVLTLAGTPARTDEDGYVGREVLSLGIGLAGAIAALVAWAAFDVQDTAAATQSRPRARSISALQFAIVPTAHGFTGLLSRRF